MVAMLTLRIWTAKNLVLTRRHLLWSILVLLLEQEACAVQLQQHKRPCVPTMGAQ